MHARLEHANLCVRDIDRTVRFLQTAFPEFRIRHDEIDSMALAAPDLQRLFSALGRQHAVALPLEALLVVRAMIVTGPSIVCSGAAKNLPELPFD